MADEEETKADDKGGDFGIEILAQHDGADTVASGGEAVEPNDDRADEEKEQWSGAAGAGAVVSSSNKGDEGSSSSNKDASAASTASSARVFLSPRRRRRSRVILGAACLALLLLIAIVVGSVCGSGKCGGKESSSSSSRQSSGGANEQESAPPAGADDTGEEVTAAPAATAPQVSLLSTPPSRVPITASSLAPTISQQPTDEFVNDACQRATGPFILGGSEARGVLEADLESVSTDTPLCLLSSVTNLRRGGLWYKVTGGGEVIRASTCTTDTLLLEEETGSTTTTLAPSGVPSTSTVLSIYKGTCESSSSSSSNLQCVGASEQFCGDHASISWLAEKGVTYYVLVQGENGDFALRMDYEQNGFCETAIGPLLDPENTAASRNSGMTTAGSLNNAGEELIFTCSLDLARGGQKWYTVVGTGSWLIASTCHAGTDFGARIEVLAGGCNAGGCTVLRDSECGGGTSGGSENGNQMVWLSERFELYHILVYKTSFRPGTNFELSVASFTPIQNDDCTAPTTIATTDGTLVMGSTVTATFDADNYAFTGAPACDGTEALHPGVWYELLGTGDVLLASTCVEETQFATEISVYTGSSCDTLVCAVTGRQFCNEKASVYWESVFGETYYILVHGAARGLFPSVGEFGLTVAPFVTEDNNQCVAATAIDTDTMLGQMILGSNFAATLDTDIPVCASFESEAPGIWYRVVGTGSIMRASTCDPTTDFDTQITVYSGSCDALSCVGTDDNSCGVQSSVAWSSTEGTVYYILVHGRLQSSVGQFALTVEEYKPLRENDFCSAAVAPPINGSVVLGSTVGSYFDNTETCFGVPNAAPGVWYFVNGTGTLLTASLCNDETNYETALTVFTGECIELECVAGNVAGARDDCGQSSEISWITKFNQPYYILVHGWDTRVGDFGLVLDEPEPDVTNDYCVSAFFLSPSSSVVSGSTIGASQGETPICSGISQEGPGVWYTVAGTGTRLVATTCNSEDGGDIVTDFDTKISVFTGICGNLNCTLADDNYCGLQSRLVWLTEPGVTYYILVHGGATGTFGLVVDEFVPDTTNDFCSSAQGPLLPTGVTYYGSTRVSSYDDVGFCGVSNTSPGVWFFVVVRRAAYS